jgi:hypothetical protein
LETRRTRDILPAELCTVFNINVFVISLGISPSLVSPVILQYCTCPVLPLFYMTSHMVYGLFMLQSSLDLKQLELARLQNELAKVEHQLKLTQDVCDICFKS